MIYMIHNNATLNVVLPILSLLIYYREMNL